MVTFLLETKGTLINGLFDFNASSEQTSPQYPQLKLHSVVCNFETVKLSFKGAGTYIPLVGHGGVSPPVLWLKSIITLRHSSISPLEVEQRRHAFQRQTL